LKVLSDSSTTPDKGQDILKTIEIWMKMQKADPIWKGSKMQAKISALQGTTLSSGSPTITPLGATKKTIPPQISRTAPTADKPIPSQKRRDKESKEKSQPSGVTKQPITSSKDVPDLDEIPRQKRSKKLTIVDDADD
jgi:hypothetical protein